MTGKERGAAQYYGPGSRTWRDHCEGVQGSSQTKGIPQKQEPISSAGQLNFFIYFAHAFILGKYEVNIVMKYSNALKGAVLKSLLIKSLSHFCFLRPEKPEGKSGVTVAESKCIPMWNGGIHRAYLIGLLWGLSECKKNSLHRV